MGLIFWETSQFERSQASESGILNAKFSALGLFQPNLLVSPSTIGKFEAMQILVDADACPVKHVIVRLVKQKSIPVVTENHTIMERTKQ